MRLSTRLRKENISSEGVLISLSENSSIFRTTTHFHKELDSENDAALADDYFANVLALSIHRGISLKYCTLYLVQAQSKGYLSRLLNDSKEVIVGFYQNGDPYYTWGIHYFPEERNGKVANSMIASLVLYVRPEDLQCSSTQELSNHFGYKIHSNGSLIFFVPLNTIHSLVFEEK